MSLCESGCTIGAVTFRWYCLSKGGGMEATLRRLTTDQPALGSTVGPGRCKQLAGTTESWCAGGRQERGWGHTEITPYIWSAWGGDRDSGVCCGEQVSDLGGCKGLLAWLPLLRHCCGHLAAGLGEGCGATCRKLAGHLPAVDVQPLYCTAKGSLSPTEAEVQLPVCRAGAGCVGCHAWACFTATSQTTVGPCLLGCLRWHIQSRASLSEC